MTSLTPLRILIKRILSAIYTVCGNTNEEKKNIQFHNITTKLANCCKKMVLGIGIETLRKSRNFVNLFKIAMEMLRSQTRNQESFHNSPVRGFMIP